MCGLLVLAVALVFGQTARHEFVNLDDPDYVSSNRNVQRGLTLHGVAWAFTTDHACNWHPLTWLSHMADCQIYRGWAGGHHLTNALLHAATAILLFLALRQMTGRIWPSALAAALFAVHPLRAESVAWIAERKDVLSGLFFMLTLMAYLRYVRHPFSLIRYLVVVAWFAVGLLTKSMLVTLPFVLLLLDWWPLGRMRGADRTHHAPRDAAPHDAVHHAERDEYVGDPTRSHGLVMLFLEKLPLLLFSAGSCITTLVAQDAAMQQSALSTRITNALVSYVAYLGKMFWPVGLAVLYPHPGDRLPIWEVAAAGLALAAISIATLAWSRKCPWLVVGWLWYLGMMVPVIGLVQVGMQGMADRYTYLPQIGLAIAVVWTAAALAQRSRHTPYAVRSVLPGFGGRHTEYACYYGTALARRQPLRSCTCGLVSAIVLATLMTCAWWQATCWRNSEAMWRHALACSPENNMARNMLGHMLLRRGEVDEAIRYWEKAKEISGEKAKPGGIDQFRYLAKAYGQQGRIDEAMGLWAEVIHALPDDLQALNQLAWLLATTRDTSNRDGQAAIGVIDRAVRLSGGRSPRILDTLAAAYAEVGRFPEAIDVAQKALSLATAAKKPALAAGIRKRIELYKAGSPVRE